MTCETRSMKILQVYKDFCSFYHGRDINMRSHASYEHVDMTLINKILGNILGK